MQTQKLTLLLATVVVSPLLMAPGEDACPACLGRWEGAVEEDLSNIFMVRVEPNQSYWSKLSVYNGKADLDVVGSPVVNMHCKPDDTGTMCIFDAKADGVVELEVIGVLGPAAYGLFFDYSN